MMNETIVVSDTNIFFDLLSVDLLDDFFRLPCKIATTDFVVNEIERPEQLGRLLAFIESKKLDVAAFESDEVNTITELYKNRDNNVSLADCSVWYYAKKNNGRLLTGDGKLRKSAEADNVKVSGILYILDNLIEYEILSKANCANKLANLINLNMRLPKSECEKRIKKWRH